MQDTADEGPITPDTVIKGYLTGSATAPDGFPLGVGIAFPSTPILGDYFLRTDYLPNRVFRFDGARWVAINDVQRTSLTPGATNQTLLGTFLNDTNTFVNNDGKTVKERQSLSTALTPKADN